ncbi:MAG: copper amine oxidase N-terminal domain-containing protein [Armatimonadetes bacterium]|nr:copper amine oxidase N-terminal domain-containing protein [Armatimonadota bacterium]
MRTHSAILVLAAAFVALAATQAYGAGPMVTSSMSALPSMAAKVTSAAVAQAGFKPGFMKMYRKRLPREIVWFNGREADLEHHARIIHGRIYITLTDLARHLGLAIVWGPSRKEIRVTRGQTTVIVCPSKSAAVQVFGQPVAGPPAVQRGGLTWVPVEPFATLFGATVTWNDAKHRLDVTMP